MVWCLEGSLNPSSKDVTPSSFRLGTFLAEVFATFRKPVSHPSPPIVLFERHTANGIEQAVPQRLILQRKLQHAFVEFNHPTISRLRHSGCRCKHALGSSRLLPFIVPHRHEIHLRNQFHQTKDICHAFLFCETFIQSPHQPFRVFSFHSRDHSTPKTVSIAVSFLFYLTVKRTMSLRKENKQGRKS